MSETAAPVVVTPAAPSDAAVEATGETAVAIAEIEANRDVKLAEIAQETATAVAEAETEDVEEDIEWLQNELAGLRAACAENAQRIESLTNLLTEIPSQMAALTAMLTEHVNQLTPPAHSPPETVSSETVLVEEKAAGPLESGEASAPPAAPEKPARRVRRLM